MDFNTPEEQVQAYLNNVKNELKIRKQTIVNSENFVFAIAMEISKKIIQDDKQDLFKPLNKLGREYFLYKTNQCSSRICCECLSFNWCFNCCGLYKLTISSQFAKNAELYTFNANTTIDEHWRDLKLWKELNILEMLGCPLKNNLSVKHVGHEIVTDNFGVLVLEVLKKKSTYDMLKTVVFNNLNFKLKVLDGPSQVLMDE